MISVLVSYIYIGIMALVYGADILKLITGKRESLHFDWIETMMAGMVVLTVYAGFFSVFGKVGMTANLILIIAVIPAFLYARESILDQSLKIFGKADGRDAGGTRKWLVYAFMLLLFSYGASKGYSHYDTGLYHAQSIRWIEEFGAVAGIGNLHCRLAYNSAAFPLTALFSFSFLGQSLHTVGGFMAFLLACKCCKIGRIASRKTILLSDAVCFVAIYYLLIILDEMVSPASDYFLMSAVFFFLIKWMEIIESYQEGTGRIDEMSLLMVYAVFAVSIKLSAAGLLLYVLWPAYYLIRDKRWKDIVTYLSLGLVVILPYLIRNVIISGWLVYPVTAIDLFDVDWKIPRAIAEYDSKEIRVWGRGYTDVSGFDLSIAEWFPGWFAGIGRLGQLFVILDVVAMLVIVVFAIRMLAGHSRQKGIYLFTFACMEGGFLYWLFTAPLIRYGCAFLWIPAVVVGGWCVQELIDILRTLEKSSKKSVSSLSGTIRLGIKYALTIGLVLLAVYKGVMFGREVLGAATSEYLVMQQDYESFEVTEYQVDGSTFYYSTQGDRTGYDPFPSAPQKANIELRGSSLSDGLRSLQ